MPQQMPYSLDETERAVLDVLRAERRANPLRIRERTGLRKQYVNDALRQLEKVDVVRRVNRGLYEYNPDADDLEGHETADVVLRLTAEEAEDLALLAEYANEHNGPPEASRWAERLRERVLNSGSDGAA